MRLGDKYFFIWVFTFLALKTLACLEMFNIEAVGGYLLAIVGFYAAFENHKNIITLLSRLKALEDD